MKGQPINIGINAGVNQTFFHKSASIYSDRYFKQRYFTNLPKMVSIGLALAIPVNIKLDKHWAINTGLGYKRKKYKFEQTFFNMPATSSTYIHLEAFFNAYEIPALISIIPTRNKTTKIEYSMGCVLSLNRPSKIITEAINEGPPWDPTVNIVLNKDKKTSTISPDIFIGMSFVHFKENSRAFQFNISYQYGLIPSTRYEFLTTANNTVRTETNYVTLRPSLSCLQFTISVFPGILKYKIEATPNSLRIVSRN